MKKSAWHLSGVACMLLLLSVVALAEDRGLRYADAEDTPRRVALVVGNSAYKSAPLTNPVNDARDMAVVLRALGFEVIEKLNADRRETILAIDAFHRRLRRADVGLFYFAGHGMQIDGINYLVPVESHVTTETDVQFEAVAAGRVLGKMRDAGANLNIVILDACRDNPFSRSFRSETAGLAQMDAPKGTIIAYATAPGSVAADGEGRNGVYTKHLIQNLKRPGLSIQDMFMETGLGVMNETGEKQVPWISSTPVPRYYLAGTGVASDRQAIAESRAKLERQEQELERLRAEIEQKRRYSENPKAPVATPLQEPTPTTAPPAPTSRETDRDGPCIALANGIVCDTETGLEWLAGPDKDTTWEEAKSWVNSLSLDGGGWRMPTTSELEDLYNKTGKQGNGIRLLKTTGQYVWSGEEAYFRGVVQLSLHVETGDVFYHDRGLSYLQRAIAVRSKRIRN